MPTHGVTEAFDAVWRGVCERHGGTHPEDWGAKEGLASYEAEGEALERWYLG